eukprot:CAMPEP_0178372004 /NCGR_PEP_ID=MMETSP0689_2-20121128/1121_1 /TAXON_ID=160604 /ORGANISM="Amphidinium massartii, Strain CS-259" /LENGTH=592 /DNA_ID=CAMNT_0019991897 /DNA_START=60 /DNA_END=1835 /DNA_ORIENTATION=+
MLWFSSEEVYWSACLCLVCLAATNSWAASSFTVEADPAATTCTGKSGFVDADTWQQVKEVQHVDTVGRTIGASVDARSEQLELFAGIFEQQVLADLEGAVQDCILGVVSLILLGLPHLELWRGSQRAVEYLDLAGELMLQARDELAHGHWPLDPDQYFALRQLLKDPETDCGGSSLKIYVYNTTGNLTPNRLRTGFGMMAAATHIHTYLRRSVCRTDSPEEADFFFVPAYHGEGFKALLSEHSNSSNSFLLQRFPYLTRKRGVDHLLVVSANLPSWQLLAPFRHAVLLTVESYQVNDDIPRWYSPWKDVMIPGYIDRYRIDAMWRENRPTEERGFLLAFHGNHPGTNELYRRHNAWVRTKILDEFAAQPDCSVGGQDFFQRMGRAHFCLVPRGSSSWTIHLYESFFFGCIPVLLSDDLEVPFQEIIDWPSFSIKWPEEEVGPKLLAHLRAISLDQRAEMKRRLEAASCWFDYHRGWSIRPSSSSKEQRPWAKVAQDTMVITVSDCPLQQLSFEASSEACKEACDEMLPDCNVVNFCHASHCAGGDAGRCELRLPFCRDVPQPGTEGIAASLHSRTPVAMNDTGSTWTVASAW